MPEAFAGRSRASRQACCVWFRVGVGVVAGGRHLHPLSLSLACPGKSKTRDRPLSSTHR